MTKLDTLEEMVSKSLTEQPHHALEAIEEYFENLAESDPKQLTLLREKMGDKEDGTAYLNKFKEAIVSTSLILFILTLETFNKKIIVEEARSFNISSYLKSFLLNTRTDDKFIFNMRVAYLSEAKGESIIEEIKALSLADNINTDESISEVESEIVRYDQFRTDILKQYVDRNSHISLNI